MHCKHSGFSVTWSLGSGSQADRPPHPDLHPRRDKGTDKQQLPTGPRPGHTELLPPLNDVIHPSERSCVCSRF